MADIDQTTNQDKPMTKQHFIALADHIRWFNDRQPENSGSGFTMEQIESLADFCKQQNYNFKRERWIDYILGECGPNGGSIKKQTATV